MRSATLTSLYDMVLFDAGPVRLDFRRSGAVPLIKYGTYQEVVSMENLGLSVRKPLAG